MGLFAPVAVSQDAPLPPASETPQAEPEPPAEQPAEAASASAPASEAELQPPAAEAERPAWLDPAVPDAHLTPAELFSRRFANTLELETQVQLYEQSTLGAEDVERMNSYQIKRRGRLDHDRDTFAEVLATISVEPLVVPSPQDGVEVDTSALVLLDQIQRAYTGSRDLREVERCAQLNRQFLDTSDWVKREAAVRVRDTLIERERAYLGLVRRARLLAIGKGGPTLRDELRQELESLAPELSGVSNSLSLMVLENPDVRKDVLGEVTEFLAVPPKSGAKPVTAGALLEERNQLYQELLVKSELTEVFMAWTGNALELQQAETRLEELPRTDIEARRETVARKVELMQAQNELRAEWYGTEPHAETADELIEVFDKLILMGMSRLGLKGSLYAERHAALNRTRQLRAENGVFTWQLLDQQDELLKALELAEPNQDYLLGLSPPPDMTALQQAKLAAFQAAAKGGKESAGANLGKAPTKPKPGAKAAKKKGPPPR